MKTSIICAFIGMLLIFGCSSSANEIDNIQDWELSALPSSVRLDPSSNEIIDLRFDAVDSYNPSNRDLLDKNWVFDGNEVNLYGARGEYVSFQLVVTNNSESPLKGILVNMDPFKSNTVQFNISSELFLEGLLR